MAGAISPYRSSAGPQASFLQNHTVDSVPYCWNQGVPNKNRNFWIFFFFAISKQIWKLIAAKIEESGKTGNVKNAFIFLLRNEEEWIPFPSVDFNWLAGLKRVTNWAAFQQQKSVEMRHRCQDLWDSKAYVNIILIHLLSVSFHLQTSKHFLKQVSAHTQRIQS